MEGRPILGRRGDARKRRTPAPRAMRGPRGPRAKTAPRRRWRAPGTRRDSHEDKDGGRGSSGGSGQKVVNGCASAGRGAKLFRSVRAGWRPSVAYPLFPKFGASPRRGRGRQADHRAAAAATACALTRGIHTVGGRRRARPGGWTRQRRARSWWQAGPGGRAGGGERAGARGPPLPVRCSAARAATAPPGPPTRQWPGHRRPDCWSAGAERVRQGRVTSATSRTGSPSPAALTLTLTLSLSLSSQHVIAQLLALQQVPHARLDKGRVDGERRAAAQRAVGRAQ